MALEVTLTKVAALLETQTTTWQTYFMHPFLA
jgi:hypothetical protein